MNTTSNYVNAWHSKFNKNIRVQNTFSFMVPTLAAVWLADNQYRHEFTSKQSVTTTICMICTVKTTKKTTSLNIEL